MIDFHNHIIPNLDDGPSTIEMALNMLREAEKQGITDIINTVHFQHPKMENKNTSYDYVISQIKDFQKVIYENGIKIRLHAASEVFYQPNLVDILDNQITTIGDGKYMLIEFMTLSLPIGYKDGISELQSKGVTPIIAHPERYRLIQNNIDIVKEWISDGYIIQIDCGSLLGTFGKICKLTSEKLLTNNLCHLVGSDAHNDHRRNFCLKDALSKIDALLGPNYTSNLINNSYNVFNGKECTLSSKIDIQNQSIFNKIKGFIRNN